MDEDHDEEFTFGTFLVQFTRVWLPISIAALGVALIVVGHGSYSNLASTHSLESAAGVSIIIVAVTVWLINWLYRLGVSSNQDRVEEERAREYYDRTGRWPDDETP